MKHLKTQSISATSCSCSYVKSMVNGGDLCLLNIVFPGFRISGVCSDIEFECFSQDLTEMLLILLSSLYLPALCITVSRDREQPAAPARADKRSEAESSADSFSFRFVCLM